MPRYELSDGTSNKFWEIELSGDSFTTTYGRIGSAGQSSTKQWKDAAQAQKEYDKLVAEKTRKGYQLVGGAPGGDGGGGGGGGGGGARNPELEQAIAADPYGAEAYTVYADWLQDQGDPRGELIALHLAGKADVAARLIASQAAYFLGPLAEHAKCYDGSNKDAFTWRNGFIHAVRLAHDHYALDYADGGKHKGWDGSLAQILDLLLRHPSGRFLAEVTINYNNDPNEDTLDDLTAILAKRAPATLRKLVLGDDVDQIDWYKIGDLSKLWKGVPRLAHFQLYGGQELKLGTVDLPEARYFAVRTGGLARANVKSAVRASLPKVEHLEIWFGDDNYGAEGTAEDVQPLLDRTDLPHLTYLALANAMFTDELCERLPAAKIIRGLKVLDLSKGILTDEGAGVLARHKDAFAHLDVLDVSETYLTDAGVAALQGLAKRIVADDLRDDEDPDYRYPAVGE